VKRAAIFLALLSVMVFVFAGVALAALIEGDDGANTLVGTRKGDAINGYGGADRIEGRGGGDTLRLGGGSDEGYGEDGGDALRLGYGSDEGYGGRGDDNIGAVDGTEDAIFCGPGSDRVRANPGDNVAEGCERIIREGIRVD
jgi:Ca2+-binding RTX toxin-like protein